MDTDPRKILGNSFRELLSLIFRLGEKMKDRYVWLSHETDEAESFLIYFRDNLKKQKEKQTVYSEIFGENGTCFSIKAFKRGYNAKSVTFKTIVGSDVKQWVLKIGHRISPVIDYGDPSTPAYFKQMQQHINILKEQTKKHALLKYLIPDPQEIMWGVLTIDGKEIQSTLMIQPFIRLFKTDQIKKMGSNVQVENLLTELNEFETLCTNLIKNHKLRPDLLGEDNLSVSKIGNDYHLVLLDMGLVDLQAPLPITQTFMHFASIQTFSNMRTQLTKLITDGRR